MPISLKESLTQAGFACTAGAAVRCAPECVEHADGSLVTVSEFVAAPSPSLLPTRALTFQHHIVKEARPPCVCAPCVQLLKRGGAIPFVRTNIPQLLMLPETMNDVFGTTSNPWNKDRWAASRPCQVV